MKTAVSIPDHLYSQAEELADAMGLPRSQLFAKALEEFLKAHRREAVTEKLDQVYGSAAADSAPLPPDAGESTINLTGRKANQAEETSAESGLDELRKATRDDAW